jgi:hypothetical protein
MPSRVPTHGVRLGRRRRDSLPLDCQPERERPGVARRRARSKSSRYRHRYRRTPWASVKHMNRLIKVHAGLPHRIGPDDERRTPSRRRPSAPKPRDATSTASRNRADMRKLTVSADRSSETLTVSGTLSSEGDGGIRDDSRIACTLPCGQPQLFFDMRPVQALLLQSHSSVTIPPFPLVGQ